MKAKLVLDLWRFPPFRRALLWEALRFFLGSALGLTIAIAVRHYLGRPYTHDGLVSLGLGAASLVLLWLVSVIRTVRAVLREQALLER